MKNFSSTFFKFKYLVIVIIIVVIALAFFLKARDYLTLSTNVDIPDHPSIVEVSAENDFPRAFWLWLRVESVENDTNNKHIITGSIPKYPNSQIVALLGAGSKNLGYAVTDYSEQIFGSDFPLYFSEWERATVEELSEQIVLNSYILIKVPSESMAVPDDCNENCQQFFQELEMHLSSNISLRDNLIDSPRSFSDTYDVGPVTQILIVK